MKHGNRHCFQCFMSGNSGKLLGISIGKLQETFMLLSGCLPQGQEDVLNRMTDGAEGTRQFYSTPIPP